MRLLPTASTLRPGEPYVNGAVKTNPPMTAAMTTMHPTTMRKGTFARRGARRRVRGPAKETGKLTVSLKTKLTATPATKHDIKCAGR